MKCPKCGYLGYERVERCRNCGYEFSLTTAAPASADLRLRDAAGGPTRLEDLDLAGPLSSDRPGRKAGRTPLGDLTGGMDELPLFGSPLGEDEPLITKPSAPRQPLAVRRATPEVARLRAEPRAPLLEWSDPSPVGPSSRPTPPRLSPAARAPRRDVEPDEPEPADAAEPASIRSRALAAGFDVGLLLLIDLVVVYFTMKICRLSPSELALLPRGPLVAFLLLQNGGYFIAFTASGQTLGKMLAGVRVLSSTSDSAPDVGSAAVRAVLWMLLALPAGLGLFTASLSRDGRGLHDRLAGTRVVRADA